MNICSNNNKTNSILYKFTEFLLHFQWILISGFFFYKISLKTILNFWEISKKKWCSFKTDTDNFRNIRFMVKHQKKTSNVFEVFVYNSPAYRRYENVNGLVRYLCIQTLTFLFVSLVLSSLLSLSLLLLLPSLCLLLLLWQNKIWRRHCNEMFSCCSP